MMVLEKHPLVIADGAHNEDAVRRLAENLDIYLKGKEMDIEGKSGINTLRIVLNEIFMTNYEMLDNPEKYLYQYK